jgi:hypothetical protein
VRRAVRAGLYAANVDAAVYAGDGLNVQVKHVAREWPPERGETRKLCIRRVGYQEVATSNSERRTPEGEQLVTTQEDFGTTMVLKGKQTDRNRMIVGIFPIFEVGVPDAVILLPPVSR